MRFRFSFLFLSFVFISCGISLRVYRPFPNESPFEYITKQEKIEIYIKNENTESMALYDGYFFEPESLKNEYGPLSYLIRKEFSMRKERYPLLLERGGRIEVDEFTLISLDRCTKNRTWVEMKARVQIKGEPVKDYFYYDEIDSKVTNCYLLGSSSLILPLLWYLPYNGFRGNREDQMNQLGRNVLDDFFSFLENEASFNPSNANKEQNPTKSERKLKTNAVPIDPKIKEIMDSL
ncbi:hypothetical protein P3G55_08275 [Leptospira sp. 96542]|nr:hypothetical protein [Leptospira sp. 96542]